MKEIENEAIFPTYHLILTQSEKTIKKVQIQNAEIEFNQRLGQNMRLKKGSSFWSLQDDYYSIYQSFNLISYLTPTSNPRIIYRVYGEKSTYVKADLFTFHSLQGKQLLLIQRTRDLFKFPHQVGKNLKIRYQIVPAPEIGNRQHISESLHQYIMKIGCKDGKKVDISYITVDFLTKIQKTTEPQAFLCHIKNKKQVFEQERQLIEIKITDKADWIKNNFSKHGDFHDYRISEIRKSKIGQIQYFYLQPENQRNKIIQNEHITLALQGGGCKGVQYVGAYQAILKNKPNTPIKSIIGSSAGSILGLAICLELTPSEIIKLCVEKLSKVVNDKKYKKIDREGQKFLDATRQNIVNFLQQFNILDEKIINIVDKCVSDQEVQEAMLQLIEAGTNPEVYKLFLDESNGKKKINLLGLLKGSLMTGDVIKDIGNSCIKIYLEKISQKSQTKIDKLKSKQKYKNMNLSQISSNLTMKELYDLTNVQFTCTAVDINNYILRFLNQKTTPDLPVCRAVQMSGSFPVAFQAQTWDQAWGKYYIHYDNIRKQIDLAGSKLTDGGTLANFPVKYLDNQDMRPMYFSHIKTDSTLMYGIGLISDIGKEPEKQKKVSEAAAKLAQKVVGAMNKCAILTTWALSKIKLCSFDESKAKEVVVDPDNPFKSIKQIPLIKFILSLLQTYSSTKDNLTQQCFSHSSYETPVRYCYKNEIKNRLTHIQVCQKIEQLGKKIEKQLALPEAIFPSILDTFKTNLVKLTSLKDLNKLNEKNLCQTSRTLYQIISKFLYYLMKSEQNRKLIIPILYASLKEQQISAPKPQEIIQVMLSSIKRMVDCSKIFMLSGIQEDFKMLERIGIGLVSFCEQLHNSQFNPQFHEILKKIRQNDMSQVKSIFEQIDIYHDKRLKQNIVDRKVLHSLAKLSNITVTFDIRSIGNVQRQIKMSEVPDIFINDEAEKHKDLISSYIFKRIRTFYKKKNTDKNRLASADGIHIVLESVPLSQMYFHEYYLITKDAILQYNRQVRRYKKKCLLEDKKVKFLNNSEDPSLKQLKVTTLTATGYHSIAIFLHASDLSEERIGQQIWKIRDLIKMNKQRLVKKYNQSEWAKLTPILLRDLQKQAIQKNKDIFKYIEDDFLDNAEKYNDQFSKIKQSVEKHISNVRVSNQELTNAIQTSLSYIVNLLLELEKTDIPPEKISQTLEKRLILGWSKDIDNNQMRAKCCQRVKNIFEFFYDKYREIIHYISLSTPYVIDQIMKILNPQERKQVWRGVILSEFLSVDGVKSYVQKILEQLKFKPNATLKQFYDCSSKKIQINFSVVQDCFVAIYNYKTRPNMPVWAAIAAATSVPEFFPPLLDRPQWRQKDEKDYKKRNVKSYFRPSQYPYIFISSSEALTRLPMDLLQNNKFQSKITDKKNQVFLVFNFGQLKFKSIFNPSISKFNVKSLTLSQCITKFLSFKSLIHKPYSDKDKKRRKLYDEEKNIKALSMIFELPFIKTRSKLLNLFIESHDNLIVKLYKRELIQMPIRFSTLDFHLMTQKKVIFNEKTGKKEEQQRLSDVCQDAIMQAEYIITEKITNRYSAQDYQNCKNLEQNISKSKKEIILQSIKSNKLIKEASQANQSQRLIYFRIESEPLGSQAKQLQKTIFPENNTRLKKKTYRIELKAKPNHQMMMAKQIETEKQELNQSASEFRNWQSQQRNVLKMRFLSMLNPSRELYEKYYIYYRNRPRVKNADRLAEEEEEQNLKQFTRVKTEALYISYKDYLELGNLQLKIEYPSSDLTMIKTNYFLIDLDKLFKMNQNLIRSEEQNSFGLVYCIQFDNIYSLRVIKPVENYLQDYMNINTRLQSNPSICIKSNIRYTLARSTLCETCIDPLQLVETQQGAFYRCPNCRQEDLVKNRFQVSYNAEKQLIQCSQGHLIEEIISTREQQRNLNFKACHLCNKSSIELLWKDPICSVIICNTCRIESFETFKDQY